VPSSSTPRSRSAGAALPADYAAALETRAHRERRGVVAIEGEDRVAFLQGQLTQEVRGLAPGESRLAAGLSPKGKLLYFGRLVMDAEAGRLLLLVPAAAAPGVAAHLGKYAAFQKASVREATRDYVRIALYGPASSVAGLPAGAIRLPPEWEHAGEILAPEAFRPAILENLSAAGSLEVPEATADILRVEAGRPRLQQDATDANLLEETGLEAAISSTKGCYVGQEIVARMRTYGRANRRLSGFRFPGESVPAGTVFPDPAKPALELARVTSSVVSPRFGPIGLGLAFRDVPEGAALSLPGRAEPSAVVVGLPFA
jgi:folate-binding protein YgfZ